VVADLIIIGLGIAPQPFRVSAFILILSSKDGTRKGLGWILGWLVSLVLVIAAVIAAVAQPWTLVAAGAVTVTQARLSGVGDWFALASFCLLATSSFLVLELYSVFAPAASTRLAALRTWLDDHGTQVLIVVCVVVGFWLAGRSGYLLATRQH